MTKKRWIGVTAVAVFLIVSVAAVLLGCGEENESGFRIAGDETRQEQVALEKDGLDTDAEQSVTDLAMQPDSTAAAGEAGIVPSPESATLPQLQLKVIKTALMEMEAEKGDYVRIKQDAVAIASAAGGYVEGESASRDDEGLTYATLTLRIPADRFDEVAVEVSALGEVVSNQVSTNDVSAEYVDLESRLRHLQAEESFYLSLIGKAQTIQEMITIREHLDSIQLEKEQVQGRMNFLDQQAGFSTLTLSVDEIAPDEEEGESFWDSVGDAFKSFGRGMAKLAVGLFYALPYLVILAVIIAVVWIVVRRSRNERTPGE